MPTQAGEAAPAPLGDIRRPDWNETLAAQDPPGNNLRTHMSSVQKGKENILVLRKYIPDMNLKKHKLRAGWFQTQKIMLPWQGPVEDGYSLTSGLGQFPEKDIVEQSSLMMSIFLTFSPLFGYN